jgi:hypothetical protein
MATAVATPVQHEPQAVAQRKRASLSVLTTAELAPCTCPEYCERDHDRD